MNKLEMVRDMAMRQDQLNIGILGDDWQGRDDISFFRAAWVECAELMDHVGWKWWKRQDTDMAQAKMEVIDVWHFLLSEAIRADNQLEALKTIAERLPSTLDDSWGSEHLAPEIKADRQRSATLANVELLARHCLAMEDRLDEACYALGLVMRSLGMTAPDLYAAYVGKITLNQFRQDHGYKTGEYIKTWDGKEDNEHLSRILESALSEGGPGAVRDSQIYLSLNALYTDLVVKADENDGPAP